ncbi:hypothetical protein GE09DRAFT_1190812 [Coniochaeta sp. 2T2.1]|nr:hypothetical protein GE09DRAFT_1190812 [Coniochaeta sp. 2T2.1]
MLTRAARSPFYLFLFLSITFAQDSVFWGTWVNPPASIGPTIDYSTHPVYTVGQTTELHWITVYSNYSIALWQQHPGGGWATLGPIIYQTFEPSNDLFNWSVSPLRFNLSDSDIFFLWLYPGVATEQGSDAPKDRPSITSHYFNVTVEEKAVPPASSSSTSVPSSPSVSVITTSVSVVAPSATEITSTKTPSLGHSSALSSGAWAGVGVGVAFLALIFLGGGTLWYRRRKKQRSQPTVQPQVPGHSELPAWGTRESVVPMKQRAPAEAAGWKSPVEMDEGADSGRFSNWRRHPEQPVPMSPRELPG